MTLFPSLKTIGTVLLKVAAFWILLVAAYLALGRQFFPYVDRYEAPLAAFLSERLGAEVGIGQLTGGWQRFNPILVAEDITVGDTASVRRLVLEPSVIQSLATLSPVFRRFELEGFVADLEQRPQGWRLAGLTAPETAKRLPLNQLTTLLRQQREVSFKQVVLHVQPSHLPNMSVILDDGQLTGAGGDNWLRANARLLYGELDVPIELQLESNRVEDHYEVDLFARHGNLDFSPWLTGRWPQMAELNLAGEYWASLRGETWETVTARLFSEKTHLRGSESELGFTNVETEIYAERHPTGFDLWVNHLGHRMSVAGQERTETERPVRARISQRRSQWQMQWDRLPLAPVSAWLALNDDSGFWRHAFPSGDVTQGKLTFNTNNWQSLRLTAGLVNGELRPYVGIPGFKGIAGRARVEGPAAHFSLDSKAVDVDLPTLYQRGIRFGQLRGEVNARWWPGLGLQLAGRNQADIVPSTHQAGQGDTELPVIGRWQVDLPLPGASLADREVGVRLALQTSRGSLSWLKQLTPTVPLQAAVTDWITGNVLTGDLHDVQFIYSAGFKQGRTTDSNLNLVADFADAGVRFHDAWPLVERGRGRLELDDEQLVITAGSGRMAGLRLEDARMALPFQAGRIDIETRVGGSAAEVLDLFQTGPLAMLSEGVVDDWQVTGSADARLSLSVPFDGEAPTVSVDGRIKAGSLHLPAYDLTVTDIDGDINYNDAQGMYSRRLDAEFFAQPHQASLRTVKGIDAPTVFELDVQGAASLAAWGQWLDDAWLGAQDVVTPIHAQLRFAPDTSEIRIQSSLLNLPLDFPEPLAKETDETRDLELHLVFDAEQNLTFRGLYDDRLAAHLEFDAQHLLERGTIALDRPMTIRDEAGVFFDLALADAEIDDWLSAVINVMDHYPAAQGGPSTQVPWIREINLSGRQWTYFGLPWTQPSVQLQRNQEAWLVRFDADETEGKVLIPHDESPMFVDVNFLALAAETGADVEADDSPQISATPDLLALMSPSDTPDMNVQIAQLSVGGRDFGSWRAELVSNANVVTARNIQGNMPGTRLAGTMNWRATDGKHQTDFKGQVTTGNINQLLRNWGYAPVLVSSNGQFDLDLNWSGTPAYFSFERLKGRIGLELNKGAILELEEYEGVKLIGLLNFTRVLRRLTLDFSDLVEDGITYDVIEGELLFDRGFARVGERLIIDGPAMKFRFSGDADLVRDALDVDMVMTIPLSSTVPLVALLAGVSPQAAAAIYVTERVFNNELERLSSARMHVTGSLEEPELRFYRVFDSSSDRQGPSVGERLKNVVPGGTGN